jgi:pyruvate formate lyase activating enzyme
MKIGGLQKTTLLDYPDIISAIVWTIDCNFRCPFCYNKNLVFGNLNSIPVNEILSFLKKRQGILEGLVISGGEPLIQKDIIDFTGKVKKLGYLIKIDTNGMFPDKIKQLIEKNLVDYIAMDVKASKKKYSLLSGVKVDITNIKKSIDIIRNYANNYEFKTTFVPNLLKKKDIIEIAKWLKDSKTYYLQQFKYKTPLLSSELEMVEPYDKEYILNTLDAIKPYFKNCSVRGI